MLKLCPSYDDSSWGITFSSRVLIQTERKRHPSWNSRPFLSLTWPSLAIFTRRKSNKYLEIKSWSSTNHIGYEWLTGPHCGRWKDQIPIDHRWNLAAGQTYYGDCHSILKLTFWHSKSQWWAALSKYYEAQPIRKLGKDQISTKTIYAWIHSRNLSAWKSICHNAVPLSWKKAKNKNLLHTHGIGIVSFRVRDHVIRHCSYFGETYKSRKKLCMSRANEIMEKLVRWRRPTCDRDHEYIGRDSCLTCLFRGRSQSMDWNPFKRKIFVHKARREFHWDH